ncbi:hypothetical protein DH2020_007101 [Rehmannia glutinosa]|uniref:Uncharacterized protein n=1 Tax=Rehmannia glutinosa TaxID=99300 RepID=A0ABR0TX87_REHGL
MEEILTERGKSLAAPVIFILVFSFHFVSKYLESYKRKKGSISDVDIQLRAEIKQLLKEASSLTQICWVDIFKTLLLARLFFDLNVEILATYGLPSTFAQAAKLRRMAAAKEKELAKHQEMHEKDMKLSFGTYEKLLMISKVVSFNSWKFEIITFLLLGFFGTQSAVSYTGCYDVMLILWFWKIPVTTISDQLVQPFGKLLSWRAGKSLKDNVVVGIIPWLIVSTRVSKFICRKVMN